MNFTNSKYLNEKTFFFLFVSNINFSKSSLYMKAAQENVNTMNRIKTIN